VRNPRVQAARRLTRRRWRDRERAFLVEGQRAVTDALGVPGTLREVFVARHDPALAPVRAAAEAAGVPVVAVDAPVLDSLSTTTTPQGVVAVANAAGVGLGDLDPEAGIVVVLDGVRDPGNAGTLVRSAAAAGAGGLVFCHGSVDPWHPKVVRAASGSLWRIRIVRGVSLDDALGALRARGLKLVGTAVSAREWIYDADLAGPVAIVLGNESWGIDEGWRGLLDETLGIPLAAGIESLNVAVAGSITLFEAARQRRMSSSR
jgi:TrmH family RNA methyltransferase